MYVFLCVRMYRHVYVQTHTTHQFFRKWMRSPKSAINKHKKAALCNGCNLVKKKQIYRYLSIETKIVLLHERSCHLVICVNKNENIYLGRGIHFWIFKYSFFDAPECVVRPQLPEVKATMRGTFPDETRINNPIENERDHFPLRLMCFVICVIRSQISFQIT